MTFPPENPFPSCILITGASSGLGREIAIHLSAHHRLLLNGRNLQRLEETRDRCRPAPGGHLIWPFDLLESEAAGGSLEAFLRQHGALVEAFVHSAALLQILPLRSLTVQMVQAGLNVSVASPVAILQALMKRKVNQRQLRNVVFISSIASQFGAKGFSAYAASKGAMDALMKSLAIELAPEVRVNSILPGGIQTPMTEGILGDPQMASKFERDYPLGIGEPQDISEMVEFLLSGRSRWITGQPFIVDGGRTSNITA